MGYSSHALCVLFWVGACMGWAWSFQSSTFIYGPNIHRGPSQPVSLAQTSVTTSLWIISDGDDDEVVMEHCCVAAVSVSARPPSITDRLGQLFTGTGRSQHSFGLIFLVHCILHRLGCLARCWVNVDIASSYLDYSTYRHDNAAKYCASKCFFTSWSWINEF